MPLLPDSVRLHRRRDLGLVAGAVFLLLLATLSVPLTGGRESAVASASTSRQPAPPAPPATGAAEAQAAPISAVLRVGMTVGDLERSIAFYRDVLGFEVVERCEQTGEALEHRTGVFGARTLSARLRLGQEQIELTQFLAPEGRPIPAEMRSNDRAFQHIAIAVTDIDRAYAHLRAHRVRHASSGPQTLPKTIPAAAGISAFYFKDPDGHVLEIIHFPPGKGDPRWQAPADSARIFLGIDHTAIVVADTDRSLRFYCDTLGLRIAGESENFGVEQEHLNNVFGARLRITALRAPSGPGVELLEYLAPADGHDYPSDSRANDLWQWQTTLVAPALDETARRLETARATRISPSIVTDPNGARALTVRDPDGHALLVTAP
mgnify:CR=1 FL=1